MNASGLYIQCPACGTVNLIITGKTIHDGEEIKKMLVCDSCKTTIGFFRLQFTSAQKLSALAAQAFAAELLNS